MVCTFLYGQNVENLKNGVHSTSFSKTGNINNGDIFRLEIPNFLYNVEKVNIRFTLDFAEEIGNTDFGVECKFAPSFPNNGDNVFTLNKNKTVNTKSMSIDPVQINNFASVEVQISNISTTINNSALTGYLSDRLRATIYLDVYYRIDVNGLTFANQKVIFSEKTAKFIWGHQGFGYAPNYQIQILKLYNFNNDPGTGNNITTKVNWNDALTLETQSNEKFINLTISEGSGFYIWRVRPIGNFYENGVANVKNHGVWSNEGLSTLEQTMMVSVPFEQTSDDVQYGLKDVNNKAFNGFFYKDKDENINYIYGRTFTEKSGVSEKVSYATTLQQTKQNQTYLPSKNNTVTSQTVYDNSGRPTLNSLPVPQKEEGLTGYKNKFMTPESNPNRPYKAEDFDQNNNIKNPEKVTNPNFSYYTGINHVASAEGYVFSRVLYDNDGTGKVKEQSGVGKKHSIAPENDAERGKTTITKYDKATPTELLRLFGNEAPNHESVIKVITFDPNGTGSITYTSKEGKTIATCLYAKQDKEELDDLNSIESTLLLKDLLTINTSSNNKIVSSRTLNLIQDSPLNLKYGRNCNSVITNFPINICEYDLSVVIAFTDLNITFPNNFQVPSNWTLSNDRKVLTSDTYFVGCESNVVLTTIPNLPKGSYFIEKQLSPKSSNADKITKMQNELHNSTMPMINMISDWLDDIKCSKDIDIFYGKIKRLEKGLQGYFKFSDNGELENDNTLTIQLNPLRYYRNLHNYYAIALKKDPINMETGISFFTELHKVKLIKHLCIDISTPVCNLLRIPIPMNLSMDLNRVELKALAGSNVYKVNPMMFLDAVLEDKNPQYLTKTQFYPDIEGYSYGYLWENVPSSLTNILETLNKTSTTNLKGNINYIYGDLYPNLQTIQAFDINNIVSLINTFKNKYQMHFPDDGFLNLPFPGTLENPNAQVFVKDFLKVNTSVNFGNLTMQQITILKIIYIHYCLLRPYMEGWEVPGTLDLMSYKMLTDNYTTDGFTHDNNNSERKLIYDGPRPRKDDCGEYISLYNTNSTPIIPVIPNENATSLTYNRQYYVVDIIKNWESQLSVVKASATLGQVPQIEGNNGQTGIFGYIAGMSPQNVQPRPVQSFDNQAGGGVMGNHINANIKLPWYARLLGAKRKIRRRINQAVQFLRAMQLPRVGGARALEFQDVDPPLTQEEIDELNEMPFINPKYNYHMVIELLSNVGFKFAKILTPYDTQPLNTDIQSGFQYTTIDPDIVMNATNILPDQWASFDGTNRKYTPNRYWRKKYELDPINGKNWRVEYPDIDPNIWLKGIYDPVYAFKYFEYHGNGLSVNPNGTLKKDNANAYRMLEIQNCFYDYSRNDVQSNTTINDCNICGIGKIQCTQTSKNWSSGQRMAFYASYRSYIKDTNEPYEFDTQIENITTPGYFTETVKQIVPNPNQPSTIVTQKVFRLWEKEMVDNNLVDYPLDNNSYNILYTNGFKKNSGAGPRFKTLVELELDSYNKNIDDVCNAQQHDLRSKLMQVLLNKCYKIVDCIPNGLSVSEQKKYVLTVDIDKIVQTMKDECKKRGKITSFRAYNQPCKYAYWMENVTDINLQNGAVPVIEYGTKGSTNTNNTSYNVHRNDGSINGCYTILPNEILKLQDGTLIENMSNIQNSNNCITFSNINLPIVANCEWTKREQTLKLEMKIDMSCVCDDITKCVPNQADSFCNCVNGQNCGGIVCLPRSNTPQIQSVNGNNMPKIKTEVTKKTITIQD